MGEPLNDTDGSPMCPRCNCCEQTWVECCHCGGDGETGPGELYEEDPLWYDEDDCDPCDQCDGNGGWWFCDCNEQGKHDGSEKP